MANSRCRRLGFEALERRELLAADLQLVAVQLTNAQGAPLVGTPVVGEKIYASIHYRSTDLTPANLYEITWSLDGVTTKQPAFAPFTGTPGTNVDLFWFHGGFVVTPGAHTLTVTVDSGNTVAEANEANNSLSIPITPVAPTSLPNKFITPIAGAQNVNWTLEGFVDVDARGFVDDFYDHYSDSQGNTTVTRDFHNGLDFRIPTFAAQDAGVNVLAAAAGTVIAVEESKFDRETGLTFGDPGNYVFIDHGNGWVSQYYHFRRDSVTVNVNDVVTAGQVIGLVGSSGNSGAAHLHFEIQRYGTPVDPFVSPADYFVTPPLYIDDPALPVGLLDFGVTNDIYDGAHTLGVFPRYGGPTFEEVRERVSDVDNFPTTPQEVIAWAIFPVVQAGDTWKVQLYRPNGTLVNDYAASPVAFQATDFDLDGDTDGVDFLTWQANYGATGAAHSQGDANFDGDIDSDDRRLWELQYGKTVISGWNWGWYNPGATENIPGTWRVDFIYNDVKVAEKSFTVGTARPEIRVWEDLATDYPVIDGRTTPFNLGTVTQNGTAATKTFRVENHGYANLTVSLVDLPEGYSFAEGLNVTIPPGAGDTFTVRLDTMTAGFKSGQVVINSNDLSEAVFNFAIEGTVVAPLVAPLYFDGLAGAVGDGTDGTDGTYVFEAAVLEAVLEETAGDNTAVPAVVSTERARARSLRPTSDVDAAADEAFALLGDRPLL